MRVTAESDRASALIAPPVHDELVQRDTGVDLEDAVGAGEGAQNVTERVFELARLEWFKVAGPDPDRIVDARQDGEGLNRRSCDRHGCRDSVLCRDVSAEDQRSPVNDVEDRDRSCTPVVHRLRRRPAGHGGNRRGAAERY